MEDATRGQGKKGSPNVEGKNNGSSSRLISIQGPTSGRWMSLWGHDRTREAFLLSHTPDGDVCLLWSPSVSRRQPLTGCGDMLTGNHVYTQPRDIRIPFFRPQEDLRSGGAKEGETVFLMHSRTTRENGDASVVYAKKEKTRYHTSTVYREQSRPNDPIHHPV